ncbi:hypothetical protein LJR220_003053 [Bradyrhizobium sp. LjRoot220]|uniref:hypothetical protein n=1 Tax=Bradyrhizobium sp. LjRoot220 TaxID=3342284 RepID=UPI003ECE672D
MIEDEDGNAVKKLPLTASERSNVAQNLSKSSALIKFADDLVLEGIVDTRTEGLECCRVYLAHMCGMDERTSRLVILSAVLGDLKRTLGGV